MSRYHVAVAAKQDLADIWHYIALDNPSAADRLIALFKNRFRQIAEFPGLGAVRDKVRPSLRSLAVGNYLIFYKERSDGVEIVRVLHGARDIDLLFEAE